MKRVMIVAALLIRFCSALVLAGPNVGIGYGWMEGQGIIAPTFGIQWDEPIGVESQVYCAAMLGSTLPGSEGLILFGFWDALNLTFPVLTGTDDSVLRALIGFGSPFVFEIDTGAFDITGVGLGPVLGLSWKTVNGFGLRLIGWLSDTDRIGLMASVYIDLVPRKVVAE